MQGSDRMVFLDPKSDIAFKKLFSSSEHKNVLISFLNSILAREEGEKIVDVVINDPNNLPETPDSKASAVDVYCTDQQGANYIVEMQVLKQQDYAVRCQYYSAVALGRQLMQGEKFEFLKPVIFVGILDFDLLRAPNFLSHHFILNVETREHSLKHFEFHFVELNKLNKTVDELSSDLEKWTYFLKNAQTLQKIPATLNKPAFKEAFDILEQGNWTTKELNAYDRYIDAIRSRENQIDTAKGEGREKGKEEAFKLIAQDLLTTTSMNITEIARLTRLSLEEIEKIKKELNTKKSK